MGGNSNIILPPALRRSQHATATWHASRQHRGARDHRPCLPRRSWPAKLRRASRQSGVGHLQSECCPAQSGQFWIGNCSRWGVISHRRQYPEHGRQCSEHQRQRRDV